MTTPGEKLDDAIGRLRSAAVMLRLRMSRRRARVDERDAVTFTSRGGEIELSRGGRRIVSFVVREGETFTWGVPECDGAGEIVIGNFSLVGFTLWGKPRGAR